jgi:hypothetical protein
MFPFFFLFLSSPTYFFHTLYLSLGIIYVYVLFDVERYLCYCSNAECQVSPQGKCNALVCGHLELLVSVYLFINLFILFSVKLYLMQHIHHFRGCESTN